ncbi:hypothetical protein [Microbacterium sp.]|uniref:hypothetical protein n=1 Tax=Microbacterium sp. TaxID=51671 RepID=UPI0039E2CA5F
MRKPLTALLLVSGLGAASLTGCAASAAETTPSATAQSTADACEVAQTALPELQDEISATLAEASSGDYSTVVESITALERKLGETADKITDADVKSALDDFGVAVGEFAGVFDGVADGDLTVLTGKAAEMQQATEGMQSAGKKLASLCTF